MTGDLESDRPWDDERGIDSEDGRYCPTVTGDERDRWCLLPRDHEGRHCFPDEAEGEIGAGRAVTLTRAQAEVLALVVKNGRMETSAKTHQGFVSGVSAAALVRRGLLRYDGIYVVPAEHNGGDGT